MNPNPPNESRETTVPPGGSTAPMQGMLVFDKPLGWTSMHAVSRVRRAAGGTKTGHAGTLDPLATGVLICCLGKATKQIDRFMGMTKIYEAGVDLTGFTTTDDREGELTRVEVTMPPTRKQIEAALTKFIGNVEQRPPNFSAVHVDGQRAYKLARKGKPVEIASRVIRIDVIEVIAYDWPILKLRITCGKGTYIRSLARDLGVALGTGGHLSELRRTAIGPYTIAMAIDAERLKLPITQADLAEVKV
jgi:tRNA pseudouridine55 synthase